MSGIQIKIDWMQAARTTDHTIVNTRDETYFIVSGGTTNQPLTSDNVRVAPPPPEDYFQFWDGTVLHDIILWNGTIDPGKSAAFAIRTAEQDNGQLSLIKDAASAASSLIVAGITNGAAAPIVLQAASNFFNDLTNPNDGDQTIGQFGIAITNPGPPNPLDVKWMTIGGGTVIETPDNQLEAQFALSNVDRHGIGALSQFW